MTNIPTNSRFTFWHEETPGVDTYNDLMVKLQEIEYLLETYGNKDSVGWHIRNLSQFFSDLVPEDFI